MALLTALASTGPRPARRAASASRVAAALTALVVVVSSLLGLRHEATTRHVRCAEHGELMDGDAPLAARQAIEVSWREGASHTAGQRLVRTGQTAALHGHEHCALTTTTRDSRVELRPPAIALASITISEVVPAAPGRETTRGDGLYRTAPKTSPPA